MSARVVCSPPALLAAGLPALALASCARETATALDLKLTLTGGSLDQVEIQGVTLDGNAVALAQSSGDFRPPRAIAARRRGADAVVCRHRRRKNATVTAVGRGCDQVVTPVATTMARTLLKDGSVEAELAFQVATTPTCGGRRRGR